MAFQLQLPRAVEVEHGLSDAASQTRQLHGLLTQWQLPHMSHEQAARLLAYVEEVLQRVRGSSSMLAAWSEGVQNTLGPEPCQVRTGPLDTAAASPRFVLDGVLTCADTLLGRARPSGCRPLLSARLPATAPA